MHTLLTHATTGLWLASSFWFTWVWMSSHIENPKIPRLPIWLLTAAVFIVTLITTRLLGRGIGRGVHYARQRVTTLHSSQ